MLHEYVPYVLICIIDTNKFTAGACKYIHFMMKDSIYVSFLRGQRKSLPSGHCYETQKKKVNRKRGNNKGINKMWRFVLIKNRSDLNLLN